MAETPDVVHSKQVSEESDKDPDNHAAPPERKIESREKTSYVPPDDGAHGFAWKKRIGAVAVLVLIVGTIVILTAVAALAFLWFGSHTNPQWHSLIARNWLPRAIIIVSEALKIAIGLYSNACSALH
jgi:hypothetical protein